MKQYLILLLLLFLNSEVFAQQEATSGSFLHLTKVEIPPFSADCTERSPACTAGEIERHLLKHIAGVGPLSEARTGKTEIPVRVIIDTKGRVSWASVKGVPEEAGKQLVKNLKKMPAFTPGSHEGEKVNTIVDLKIPIYFSESEISASDVVFSDEAEQQPVWKNCRNAKDSVTCTATAINDWMNRNVRPSAIKEPGIYQLTASFVIGVDGKVSRIVVLGGGDDFANEVIRQIQKLPEFEPARAAGKPVAASFLLPMSFRKS